MKIDSNTVVTMSEANKNFSSAARLVDQYGSAVIFKNSVPRYLMFPGHLPFDSASYGAWQFLSPGLPRLS